MSQTITFVLHGGVELERAMRELPPRTAKKVVNQALRAGAKLALQGAKQLVPVDTGRLQRSLRVRALPRSRRSFGVAVTTGAAARGARTTSASVRDAESPIYGGWVEFGHLIGKRAGRKGVSQDLSHFERGGAGRVAATPYQRDAMDENKEGIIAIVNLNTARGIAREFKAMMSERAFNRGVGI